MKKKTKNLLGLVFGITIILLALPLIFATQTSLGTYEKGSCIDLIQTCGDCTYNNITSIIYPNTTKIVLDVGMTKRGTEYNYTYCFPELNGKYFINGDGDYIGDGNPVIWVYSLALTPTGQEIDEGQGITSVGIIISMILLAGMFSYFGFKLSESDKLFPIAIFFLVTSLIVALFAMQLAYIASRDILFPLSTEGMQFKILLGIMWGLLGVSFIALLGLIIKTLKEIRIRKSIQDDSDGYDNK